MDPARTLLGALPDPRSRGWLFRLVRRALRIGIVPFVVLMERGHRVGRTLLHTEYVVDGACKRRGMCCHHVLVEWTPFLERHPLAARVVLWKLTRFYSFFDKGYTWEVEDGFYARVLGCHALRADGTCGEYRTRPLFCRTYPELPLTGRPLVLRGCGYRFRTRDGHAIEESSTPEHRSNIERRE